MKLVLFSLLVMFAANSHAQEQRVYQRDVTGRIQYHKPSYVVQENGRVIETDAIGKKQYHKQQYVIKDRSVYPTDSLGRIQYNEPSLTVQRKK
jgi:hypothetical protein